MGDPRKNRKKYSGPSHPWQKARIDEEKVILQEYALKNKKELWKMTSKLRSFAFQAKKLVSLTTKQAEKEEKQLLKKIKSLGLLTETATLSDVLAISPKQIFERRLQTLVYRKGLANSMAQARQFVVHGHINVKGRKINAPSYLIKSDEERHIEFSPSSAIASQEHPERKSIAEKKAHPRKEKPKKMEEDYRRGGRRGGPGSNSRRGGRRDMRGGRREEKRG